MPVYDGHLEANPFKTVRFEGKVRPNPYEVPSDEEVQLLLGRQDPMLHSVLMICLLSGMRAGEAIGLEAEDLVSKGKAGLFFHVSARKCPRLMPPLEDPLRDTLGNRHK